MTAVARRAQKFVPDIVALSPTSIETWTKCERRYLLRHVLGIPPSDTGISNDEGLRLHAVLRYLHERRNCQDNDVVREVLTDHDCDTDAMRTMIARHRDRCPTAHAGHRFGNGIGSETGNGAEVDLVGRHEIERARYHHRPVPMFIASARLDAVWVHDGLFEVRDYKSGGLAPMELQDDPRAWVQAWVFAPRALHEGARLQLRYEYLAPEVRDDPEPWEPDDDDLIMVEERLRQTVVSIHDSSFAGVSDVAVCTRCQYRSICSQSAAPGVPTWPSLAVEAFDEPEG